MIDTVPTEVIIMKKHLQSDRQQSSVGHLIILGCSNRKINNPNFDRVPALEVYDGPNYRVLRKYLRENGWPPGLMIKIISAKHKILDATTLIKPYNQRLDKRTAKKMNSEVMKNLGELELPETVFINIGEDYLPAISCITTLFGSDRITYAEGGIGQKQQALKQWLHDLPNCPSPVPFQQSNKHPYLYFFPDWDDYVYEPFNPNETPEFRQSEDVKRCYAHEIFGKETPYDGLLYSLAQLRTKMGPLNRLYRKESFDLRGEMRVPAEMPLFGDCGAFSYIAESEPPLSSEEAASLYHKFGFNLAASVDHIPISSLSEKEKKDRMDLTAENAEEFLEIHRSHEEYQFLPVGSIQGITPDDYVRFTHKYVGMGYKHIALGGLVRRKDSEILEIVAAVRGALQQYTRGENENIWIHLFGILRADLQESFQTLGVSSFDSASYMRTAWTSSTKNYFAADGSWYGSIRVPISTSKRMRDAAESHATISNEYMQELEKKCLVSLERFDRKEIGAQEVLDSINEYNTLLQRKGTYNRFSEKYKELLENRPWEKCACKVCKDAGIDIVIFRGANRNRRRGFHNTWVFYHKILHKGRKKSSRKSGT